MTADELIKQVLGRARTLGHDIDAIDVVVLDAFGVVWNLAPSGATTDTEGQTVIAFEVSED